MQKNDCPAFGLYRSLLKTYNGCGIQRRFLTGL